MFYVEKRVARELKMKKFLRDFKIILQLFIFFIFIFFK